MKALENAPTGFAADLPDVAECRWAETMDDCFVFVMAAHENMHLGQLSAWRRVQVMGRV